MDLQSTLKSNFNMADISANDKFSFDLNGFIVLRGILTEEEIKDANLAVDRHQEDLSERTGILRNTKEGTPFSGDGVTGRRDLSGMLSWPEGQREVFRKILAHPKLVPYYTALLGNGYRMDHLPLLITQEAGAEGFSLHGGPLTGDGSFNPTLVKHALTDP